VSRARARRAATVSSAVFAVGAVTVATVNALAPFQRGWWLAAYLFLVGSLSQQLLLRGQEKIETPGGEPSAAVIWTGWALWNAGTATVAAADMAQVMTGVDIGSAALLMALALFLSGARRAPPERRTAKLGRAYTTLLVLLGSSVLLGTFLAGATPGQ
jgi:hypothetical protein